MNKKPLFVIFLVVFIDLLGFGIIIPILPYYAVTFGANATTLGFLMMSYSLMQFIFSPFWGRLSDHIGRRPILLTCIAGIGLSMLVLGFARSMIWLFVGRILAGFFGANISTASAYIADVTPPNQRAKGMGLIGAAFGLGFLFGPAFGGFLSRWGYEWAAWSAAALSLFNLILAFFILHEPKINEETREAHRQKLSRLAWHTALSRRETKMIILVFFFVTLGMAQLEASFAFFVMKKFGLDAFHAGLILALMALVMAGIQGRGIGKLAGNFGEKNLVICGAVLMALALVGAAVGDSVAIFTFFILVYAVGYSVTNPSLLSLASQSASPEIQGSVMGFYQSAGSLGRIFGPPAAGFLFDRVGVASPFLFSSLIFCVVFGMALWQGRSWVFKNFSP